MTLWQRLKDWWDVPRREWEAYRSGRYHRVIRHKPRLLEVENISRVELGNGRVALLERHSRDLPSYSVFVFASTPEQGARCLAAKRFADRVQATRFAWSFADKARG